MDIGASGVDEYSKENRNAQLRNNNNSMLAPQQQQQQHQQQSILLQVSSALPGSQFLRSSPLNAFLHDASSYRHVQDSEPWRGSSGFGLANILNRSLTSSSSSGSGGSSSGSAPLPKFSLPSLHAFGKPLLSAKPEISAVSTQHSMLNPQQLNNQRSPQAPLKLESIRENPRPLTIHTSDPSATERKPAAASAPASPLSSKETTPRKQNNSSNNSNARRIAPAPADDEDGDQDDDLSGSIRGGRWTADEHERFLAGFRIHGHKWKRVQQVVRTRSVTQVRTHAQKYLLKVAKLKAEKKQGKVIDVSALNDRYLSGRGGADSSSDNEQGGTTAPSSPDNGAKRYDDDGFDGATTTELSPKRTPPPQRKKMRHHLHHNQAEQRVDVLDQEYIAAAATTLCFLMSQKIDTLFDNRNDMDKDLEPYDCYSDQQSVAAAQLASSAAGGALEVTDKSRKRTYMHFLTESPVQYPADGTHFSYDENDQRTETPSYAIEGKKLYS
jgi:SHAQKYF class myb-like DNA-binding protein